MQQLIPFQATTKKCPECGVRFKELSDLRSHLDEKEECHTHYPPLKALIFKALLDNGPSMLKDIARKIEYVIGDDGELQRNIGVRLRKDKYVSKPNHGDLI